MLNAQQPGQQRNEMHPDPKLGLPQLQLRIRQLQQAERQIAGQLAQMANTALDLDQARKALQQASQLVRFVWCSMSPGSTAV